jgi:uncharacterized surface protein with fasciclin (FAS1) repeats
MKNVLFATLLTAFLGIACASNHMAQENGTIADIVAESENFTTLLAALEAADLVEVLAGEGPFTVFAPTDEAFAAIPEADLQALLADPEALHEVLLYHVVPGAVTSADVLALEDGTEVETVQGSAITVSFMNGMVMVDDATVTEVDIMASNGVIHVIDAVILPGE